MSEETTAAPTGQEIAKHRPAVEELLTRPFPAEESYDHPNSSGPGHFVVLQTSRDFEDDPGYDVVEAALDALRGTYDALSADLSSRWGEPETVTVDQLLRARGTRPFEQPLEDLLGVAESMRVWRHPDQDRWVALTVAQGDMELPFELTAAVGRMSALARLT